MLPAAFLPCPVAPAFLCLVRQDQKAHGFAPSSRVLFHVRLARPQSVRSRARRPVFPIRPEVLHVGSPLLARLSVEGLFHRALSVPTLEEHVSQGVAIAGSEGFLWNRCSIEEGLMAHPSGSKGMFWCGAPQAFGQALMMPFRRNHGYVRLTHHNQED
jgi:hypothetical protein